MKKYKLYILIFLLFISNSCVDNYDTRVVRRVNKPLKYANMHIHDWYMAGDTVEGYDMEDYGRPKELWIVQDKSPKCK